MGIFGLEGPVMRFFDKVFNLLWLNILVMIFSLPIVTMGASFTAMHYVLLRMAKNEEGYVLPDFWKSFRQNFKQATLIWLPFLFLMTVLGVDAYLFSKGVVTMPGVYKIVIYFLLFVVAFGMIFVFPVLSHYDNTIKGTVKNAYAMAMFNPIKSILMLVLYVAPWAAAMFVPNFIFLCLFYGFSLPGFFAAIMYDGIFERFQVEEAKAKARALEEQANDETSDDSNEASLPGESGDVLRRPALNENEQSEV